MLKKFKITYITVTNKEKTEEVEATSKYDAKQRFYRMHPKYEIIKIEEISVLCASYMGNLREIPNMDCGAWYKENI